MIFSVIKLVALGSLVVPTFALYSPDTEIVSDVAVDGRQREDRRLQNEANVAINGFVLLEDIAACPAGQEIEIGFAPCDTAFKAYFGEEYALGEEGMPYDASFDSQVAKLCGCFQDSLYSIWLYYSPDSVTNDSCTANSDLALLCKEESTEAPTSAPTSAPTEASTSASTNADRMFQWEIASSNNPKIAFNDNSTTDELSFHYTISDKDYNVTVMNENCTSDNGTLPISLVATDKPAGGEENKKNVTVTADIDLGALEGSDVWTPSGDGISDLAYITFCVRLDLLFGTTSMNFLERTISLALNMTSQKFSVDASNLDRTEGQAVNETIEANYQVEACQCTSGNECVSGNAESALTQGDSLYICLRANATDVYVEGVNTLDIVQDAEGGTISQKAIESGVAALASVTQISYGGNPEDNEYVVRTQLFANFFNTENPGSLSVSGVAKLAFKNANGGSRKLAAGIVDIRMLQEENEEVPDSEFDVEVNLKSNTDTDEVFSSSTMFTSVRLIGHIMAAILVPVISKITMQ